MNEYNSETLGKMVAKHRSTIPAFVWETIEKSARDGDEVCCIRVPRGLSSVTLVRELQAHLATCDSLRLLQKGKPPEKQPYIPTKNFSYGLSSVEIIGNGLIKRFNENYETFGIQE